jgi:hypothetical protein
VGSPSSRAAARMLLKQKERVEERKTNRPPDVRIVFDIPRHSVEVVSASAERARGYRVDRYVDGEEIVEIVFPAHAYIGECLGVCSVPTGVSVEEALRLLRENRRMVGSSTWEGTRLPQFRRATQFSREEMKRKGMINA